MKNFAMTFGGLICFAVGFAIGKEILIIIGCLVGVFGILSFVNSLAGGNSKKT